MVPVFSGDFHIYIAPEYEPIARLAVDTGAIYDVRIVTTAKQGFGELFLVPPERLPRFESFAAYKPNTGVLAIALNKQSI
jgi:hypothetical protein